MSTETELLAAYRAFDLDADASAAAIKARYRELAHAHHPDKHPVGSPEHDAATERMRQLNVAYDLIATAPLRGKSLVTEAVASDAPSTWQDPLDRPLSVLTETLARFALGVAIGVVFAVTLANRDVPGVIVYGWVIPLAFGLMASSTSRILLDVLWFLRWFAPHKWRL